ncbi:MAG: hypothetical protein GYA45_05710 [Pelolinea sp.]|jgi:hypothetical protein|nr:hypothetical protein [Pelolinea sp.]
MDITTSIALSSDEEKQLAAILNCSTTTFKKKLEAISSAAMEEYTKMILGSKVFSSGTDMRVYRLCLLIDRCFTNILPNEEMVSRIFQTTTTQSRALLRSVVSKYQYVLKEIINRTISKLVEDTIVLSSKKTEILLVINNNSRFFIDLINEKIAGLDVTLPSLSLRPHCSASYQIQLNTYRALCKEYGLKAKV